MTAEICKQNHKVLGYKMNIKPGINNTIGDEKYISYYPANNELILADHQGCAIVLGKDIPENMATGAGGRGEKEVLNYRHSWEEHHTLKVSMMMGAFFATKTLNMMQQEFTYSKNKC